MAAGQSPGGPPGFNGQFAGANGGGQSSLAGAAAGSPEHAIQQLLDKLNKGEMADVASLFSPKATGLAKSIREGKASEAKLSELKSGVAGASPQPAIKLQGKHLIVLEQASASNQGGGGGYGAPAQSFGGRNRRDQTSKPRPTLKVQFTVVSEEGQMVIQDIKISKSTAQIRQR